MEPYRSFTSSKISGPCCNDSFPIKRGIEEAFFSLHNIIICLLYSYFLVAAMEITEKHIRKDYFALRAMIMESHNSVNNAARLKL